MRDLTGNQQRYTRGINMFVRQDVIVLSNRTLAIGGDANEEWQGKYHAKHLTDYIISRMSKFRHGQMLEIVCRPEG